MSRLTSQQKRRSRGSVMPFVAVSVVFFLSMLGVAVDMMADFQAVNQLEYAAQTAALYGLSLATAPDSTYLVQSSQTRVQNAVLNNTALWNTAASGPKNQQATVGFAAGDVQFVPNPLEAASGTQEYFLDITARRTGQNALVQFFLPLLYVGFSQPTVPAGVSTMSPFRTVEVIGQPASRVGAGAPLNSPANSRAADLVGFAAFPFALNYTQFQLYSHAGQKSQALTVDLVSAFTGTALPNHMQAAFVDVSPNLGSVTGYGGAQSATTLQNLLQYFGGNQAQNIAPAAVERGGVLKMFSLQNVAQAQVVQALTAALAFKGTTFNYSLPVLQGNTIVGFARASLTAVKNANAPGTITMTVTLGDSLPCRNASSALGYSANPSTLGVLMPPPLAGSPFLPRTVDGNNNLSLRPTGVVLAPALSPRTLPKPVVLSSP